MNGVSTTAPYYVTSDGEEFSVADVVSGKVKLKGKKYKVKSLSDKIMDKDFGKVRDFGDKNKKKKWVLLKKSFKNSKEEIIQPQDFIFNSTKESNTEPAGRNGFSALEMSRDIDGVSDNIYKKIELESSDFDMPEELLEILLNMSDVFDEEGMHSESDFSDFLIKKFAGAEKVDYVKKFNDLCLKIQESEVSNSTETLKKLAKKFTKIILFELNNGKERDEAELIAYNRIILRANRILGG